MMISRKCGHRSPAIVVAALVLLGCNNSNTVAPVNEAPTVSIVSASPWITGVPVQFVASAHDPDGAVVSYAWDFDNDGTVDTTITNSAKVSHTYGAGTYTAKLRVTDNDGARSSATVELTIGAAPSTGVYVSTSAGNDGNDGTVGAPVATLAAAYALAQVHGQNEILVEAGTYNERPVFVAGVRILGGRTLPTWGEGAGMSTFQVGTDAATASDITAATLVRRVELVATTPVTRKNSIALYSAASNAQLRFEECRFIAAQGAGGANGAVQVDGQNGGNGGNGKTYFPLATSPGGAGGTSPVSCPGGAGGFGGGAAAEDGACNGGSAGQYIGLVAQNGFDGNPGADGSQGVPASADGSMVAEQWVPATSGSGTRGGNGRGGGGGASDGIAAGGGGGGGAAEGGRGGSGGQGGFASFAVMLVASSPEFISCQFQSGNGGQGGRGSDARFGGLGGAGGAGVKCSYCTSFSGKGGAGGNGGNGGGGAGGPGGPSFGIYMVGGSVPNITSPGYMIGAGGSGGGGGLNPYGDPAPPGPTGLAGNTN